VDDELRRLERAHEANPADSELIERLIQCRLRMGLPVPGALQEARALPARRFDSSLSLQVQVLKPRADKPLGLGKTPAGGDGLAIPVHCVWWAIPAPPGPLDLDALRAHVISEKIPGLSFEKKKLDDRGLARLAGLDLTTLSLKKCPRITDRGMAHVATILNLCRLDLTRTGVTDAGLEPLTGLRHLFELRLWKDYACPTLTSAATRTLASCTNLMRLELGGCHLGRDGLERLTELPELRELDLMDCGLVDDDATALARLDGLEALNLSSNDLGDAGLRALSGLTRLRYLKLPHRVTHVGVRALAALPALEKLDLLGGIRIDDAMLDALAALPALEQVDFGACPFQLETALTSRAPRRFDLCYELPSNMAGVVAALEEHLEIDRVLPRPKAGRR
jgi:hypothetical protein